jgi:hypothetical protein
MFRIIVKYADGSIYDIWEQEFRWRKDGVSKSLCNGMWHAIEIKPEGGSIEVDVIKRGR